MTGPRRSKYVIPITPLLRWKLDDKHGSLNSRCLDRLQFPVRKLAAGLWEFHFKELFGGGKALKRGTHRNRRASQGVGEVWEIKSKNGRAEAEDSYFGSSKKRMKSKVAATTKWDTEIPEIAEELDRFYSQKKLVGERPFTAASAANSNLKAEQVLTKRRICSLESRHRSWKKKCELFKAKLEEDKTSRSCRDHPKLGVVINELDLERKNRRKIEILNARLVKELTDAKMYATKYKQEYEKEKKSRVLMEEVCTELTKQIVEDKANVDALKEESMKLCEKLEEERNMLQMAEVWREERIQMKLIDAKLALEDKYLQMNKLITDLENFLMSRSEKLDVMELKRVDLIQQAAKSVTIEDIEELFNEPQTQNLMLSLLEDLEEANSLDEEIEQCNTVNVYTQDSHDSRLHTCSSPRLNQTDLDENIGDQDEHVFERKITKSIQSQCGDSPSRSIREICSISSKQTKEKMVDESRSGRHSNRTVSSEGGGRSWQQETENPHIRRETKGCIEWPKGIQRNCFKTKPLDARIQSQKSQLRHVLKHKAK